MFKVGDLIKLKFKDNSLHFVKITRLDNNDFWGNNLGDGRGWILSKFYLEPICKIGELLYG